jgi:biotin synthase
VVQVSTYCIHKTGGCPEDCGYCPQARYHTEIEGNDLMSVSQVKHKLYEQNPAPHVYVWGSVEKRKDGPEFDQVLEMVRTINKLDMEVCCTLGMITENQAHRLAEAGLYAYNHNLDTQKSIIKK